MSENLVEEATVPTKDWLLEYAAPSVIQALSNASITRQHAQLLAVLSLERQAKTVEALLSLESLPSVLDLCRSIEKKAVRLDGLPFSTNGENDKCSNCIHNSNVHAKLFDKHVAPGLCTNTSCAEELWKIHADNIGSTLPSKYKVIRIEPKFSGIRVSEDSNSVGEDQYLNECSSTCEEFGASIVGSATTGIEQCVDVCFNSNCYAEKMLATRGRKLADTRHSLWRKGLQRFVYEADRGLNRVVMLCMVAGGWSVPSNFGEQVFGQAVDPAAAYKLAAGDMPPEKLTEGLHEMAVAMVEEAPIHQVRDLLKVLDVPLGSYFPMEKAFLERLDVADIEAIMQELNVDVSDDIHMARQVSSVAFAKAVAEVIPAQALQGYLPPMLRP